MRKTVIILSVVCWICSLLVPLEAQTMLGAYHQGNPVPAQFAEPEAAVFSSARIESIVFQPLPDFRLSSALERQSALLFAEPESLLSDYYRSLTRKFIPPQPPAERLPVRPTVNRTVFNALYNARSADEKEIVRRQWQETFGVDVWYAYYKARDVEDWVKQRLSIKIGRLKGEPVADRTRVFYTFKSRF